MQAVLILAALYVPGHFVAWRLTRKGDGFFEIILLRTAASLAVAAPVLTALALVGWFRTPVIVGCLVACAVAAWASGRRFAVGGARPGWWDLAGLALVAGAFVLYARPAEYIVNSRDPGVYALISAKLARTGALLHHDPLVDVVASFHTFADSEKYPGFYILGRDLIVPQFFPAPFAFLGLGELAGGTWGALFVAPVMGALSVGFAYALGAELFGRWAGGIGAALLATSYTQIWWSRHPSSEVMTQALVLAGLWLAVRFVRDTSAATGILAGVLLGGAMLVRVDGFLAAAAIPLLFGYERMMGRPAWRWLYPGVPLVLFAGASLLYLNTIGGRYLYLIYSKHGLDAALAQGPYFVGAALSLAVVFFLVRRQGASLRGWMHRNGRWLGLAGALAVVGAALWAYFILPMPWGALPESSREFNAYKPQILLRMVWFVTPAVAALALVGLVFAGYRLDTRRALLLGAVLSFGLLYTIIPNVAPDLPWATRRFVPTVFPGVCLLAGYATVEVGRLLGRHTPKVGIALSVVLVVAAFAQTINVARLIPETREYEGAIEAFDRVESEIPEAEVVFMQMPDGYDFTASTFEYAYGRPVLPYDRDRFREELDELREAGLLDDAVYVTTDGGPPPLISGLRFRLHATQELKLPRLTPAETLFPTRTEDFEMSYRIYRLKTE